MSAQAKAYDALPVAYTAVRLATNLFKKPVSTVVDWVAVRVRGKEPPTHWSVLA